MPAPTCRDIPYRPDIDGLRAIAVLPVVLYHAKLGFPGGFVGVDVFFVISGFLITSVVQNEIERCRFSLLTFWERRFRRLMPALAVMVAATLVTSVFILLPKDFRELGQSAVAQSLMVANVYFWRETGYFAASAEVQPLLHLWSLAVEEQFYLILPLVLMPRWPRRLVLPALILVLGCSFGWSVYATANAPASAFYLLPSRAWELLIGVGLARVHHRVSMRREMAEVLAWIGFSLIGFACFAYSTKTPFPGVAALAPCVGAALVILTGSAGSTHVRRVLSTPPLVFIGLLSYSLYLWHWPLFAFANYLRFGPLSAATRCALVVGAFVAALVSWWAVERPFRTRAVCPTQRRMFLAAGAVLASVLVAGLTIHVSNGLGQRFSLAARQAAAGASDTNPLRYLRHDLPTSRLRQELPRVGDQHSQQPPELLILGDSHADALMPLFDSMCKEFGVPTVGATQSATPPCFQTCDAGGVRSERRKTFQRAVFEQLESLVSVRHVLLVARWQEYDAAEVNEEALRSTIELLSRRGCHVWIMRQVPEQRVPIPRALALSIIFNRDVRQAACSLRSYEARDARTIGLFAECRSDWTTVIDPTPFFFADSAVCRIADEGRPLYADDDHLSAFGAMHLRSVLLPMFQRIVQERAWSAEADMKTSPARNVRGG